MSITKGKLRRSAVVVAFTLGAFQALSIVGANVASATVTTNCQFAGGVLTLGIDAGTATTVSQDNLGVILVDGLDTTNFGGTCGTSLAANNGTVTAINVTGPAGVSLTNESFTIQTSVGTTSADWKAINWTVNLGDNGVVPPGDTFGVTNVGNTDDGVETDWGANGVDLNGDGDLDVSLAGVETSTHTTGAGDATLGSDTVNAGGTTITGAAYPTAITINGAAGVGDEVLTGGAGSDSITGGAGDDVIAGGLGNDSFIGGGGEDTADYSGSATAVTVLLGAPGVGSGEGLDSLTSIEDVIASDHGDTITGDGGNNVITAGAGADKIDGAGGVDTYDASAATTGVTVDLGAGTSTGGSGADTLSHIENVDGSESDDTITGNAADNVLMGEGGNDTLSGGTGDGLDGEDTFDGGGGIDTLDYSLNTLSTTVDLGGCTNCGAAGESDNIIADTIENAMLGSGDDTFFGSVFNNIVFPNGGQNSLTGEGGIDTVNYSTGYTAGVTINLANGGGTGGSSDSINEFSNATGTAFNDSMTGSDFVNGGDTGANLLVGGKGSDSISANAGPDLVRGGAGNDAVRGGNGDDTLKGQGGKDNIRGGGGDDDIFGGKGKDFCNGGGGHDLIKTCEKPKHHGQGPNGPGLHQQI